MIGLAQEAESAAGIVSEPGAVATGPYIQHILIPVMEHSHDSRLSFGPVATAPGSDRRKRFLCKAVMTSEAITKLLQSAATGYVKSSYLIISVLASKGAYLS
jgi:hypothetical protein